MFQEVYIELYTKGKEKACRHDLTNTVVRARMCLQSGFCFDSL